MQKKADETQRVANNKLEAEQRKNREQIAELKATMELKLQEEREKQAAEASVF